jgi:putative nucleotidyltransferase with HDIG domain
VIKISEYIQARGSQLSYYREVPLYNKIEEREFVLYKPSGRTLGEMRIEDGRHPERLFIKQTDKLNGIREAQKAFNKQLEQDVKSGNPEKVKETLVNIVEETLREPRSGGLEGISETVDILISDYTQESNVVANLIKMSGKDYSTILHSINVMAFSLAFASYSRFTKQESKLLGLCSLLHDVGKTKIDQEILHAPRKLTDNEFEIMKTHTINGYKILKSCNFKQKEIGLCALEHHEKTDGSGYPYRKKETSPYSQIIAIIDCYEALTNDERPYRSAMEAFDALNHVVGKDVRNGKFNREVYSQFVKSLGNILQ